MKEYNKLNLLNFDEFKRYFLEEKDDLKLCVSCTFLLDKWPFKLKKDKYRMKIKIKIGQIVQKYYEEYFEDGIQHKEFTEKDKIVICSFLRIITRIFQYSEYTGFFLGFDKLFWFALCFDKDVILSTFNAFLIIDQLPFERILSSVQKEVLFKLANLDVSLNDLFVSIQDKIHKPIEEIYLVNGAFGTARELCKKYKASDVHVSLLKQRFASDEKVISILKQNSVLALFQSQSNDGYYHRLFSFYNLLDLEGDREKIKRLDISKLTKHNREAWIKEIDLKLILEIEDIFFTLPKLKDNFEFLKKNFCFKKDSNIEFQYAFERYIRFYLKYNYNFVHVVTILELEKDNGMFYIWLKDALENQEDDKNIVFDILELLFRTERENVLNMKFIMKLFNKFLDSEENDTLNAFLKTIYAGLICNEELYNEFVKGGFVEKCCSFLKFGSTLDLIKILLDMLFFIYKKESTNLPFEESQFIKICLDLIVKNFDEVGVKCCEIISYFLNDNPLCIKKLNTAEVEIFFDKIKSRSLTDNIGVAIINVMDSLSLNTAFKERLMNKRIFSSVLKAVKLYLKPSSSSPEENLNFSVSTFLKHHPEFVEEYAAYFLKILNATNEMCKNKTPSDEEKATLKAVLKSVVIFNEALNGKPRVKYEYVVTSLLVDIYLRVCEYVTIPYDILESFPSSFLGHTDSSQHKMKIVKPVMRRLSELTSTLRRIADADKNLDYKEDNEIFILVLKAEKLNTLIAGMIFSHSELCGETYSINDISELYENSMFLFTLIGKDVECFFDNKKVNLCYYYAIKNLYDVYKNEGGKHNKIKATCEMVVLNLLFVLKCSLDIFNMRKKRDFLGVFNKFLNDFSTRMINIPKKKLSSPCQIKHCFEILKKLSNVFRVDVIEMFAQWLNQNGNFNDICIKEEIIAILAKMSSKNITGIKKRFKKKILDFIKTIEAKDDAQKSLILTVICNIYESGISIDKETEDILIKLITKNYFVGCKNSFKFMMKNTNFIIEKLHTKNYDIFVDDISEGSIDYIAFILNYHYDPETMYDMMVCAIEAMAVIRKRMNRGILKKFLLMAREKDLFTKTYDFELPIKGGHSTFKIADMFNYFNIEISLVKDTFERTIEKSKDKDVPFPWRTLLSCSKYYEARQYRYDLLVDKRVLDLCMTRGDENKKQSMLVLHYLFQTEKDFINLRERIEKISSNDLGIFRIFEGHILFFCYRCPNVESSLGMFGTFYRKIGDGKNDVHKNDVTQHTIFTDLMKYAESNVSHLFILTEILFNYSRHIEIVDLPFIETILNKFVGKDSSYLIKLENQTTARRVFDFLAVCFHNSDSSFIVNLNKIAEKMMNNDSVMDKCSLIFLLCNISNPLIIVKSQYDEKEINKKNRFGCKQILENQLIDKFILNVLKFKEEDFTFLDDKKETVNSMVQDLGFKTQLKTLQQNDFYFINFRNSQKENELKFYGRMCEIAYNSIYNIIFEANKDKIEKSEVLKIEILPDEGRSYFYTFDYENESMAEGNSIDRFRAYEREEYVETGYISDEKYSFICTDLYRFEKDYRNLDRSKNKAVVDELGRLGYKFKERMARSKEYEAQNSKKVELKMDYIVKGEVIVPVLEAEELNLMNDVELEKLVLDFTERRKKQHSTYKPIEKKFLYELNRYNREIFRMYEKELESFYASKIAKSEDLKVNINEETIDVLIEEFLTRDNVPKPQIYNICRILTISKTIRGAILRKCIAKLLMRTGELLSKTEEEQSFESVIKCLDLIHLMIVKNGIEDVFTNSTNCLVRSLFTILRYKEVSTKAVLLLNVIDFGDEIFDTSVKSDFGTYRRVRRIEAKQILEESNFIENNGNLVIKIVNDLLNLSNIKVDKKIRTRLENIINKIGKMTLIFLLEEIIKAIFEEISCVLKAENDQLVGRYIESASKIENLVEMLSICFSLFEKSGNLGIQISQNNEKSSQKFATSLQNLISTSFEKVLARLSKTALASSYKSRLYNIYFTLLSTCDKNSHSTDCDSLKNNLKSFLADNSQDFNKLFNTETDVFINNIDFLYRFNAINFDNKLNYIKRKIREMDLYDGEEYIVEITRENIVEDSLFQLMNKSAEDFKAKKLRIFFDDEEGEDYGGLTREWLEILVNEITQPVLQLFVYTSEKKTSVLPSRNSSKNPDHLLYFRFVGRILAKSILERITLDLHIEKCAYKYILGKKCELGDLEAIDPQFYNSLIWIRNNPIENVVHLTFSTEYTEDGETKIVDLKPNGRNIVVTDENKEEYINLIVDYKLYKGIEEQLDAMKEGLFEILDRDLLTIFNESEFELLISGIPEIDVEDWQDNTEYFGYTENSPTIVWFWKAVNSFTPEERAKVIQFCTGSSRVPYEGFSQLQGIEGIQKFSIHKANSNTDRLPSAHTCFNQLDLPDYPSFADLRKNLLYAINECSVGFGFV
ncbi:E3 ubiquitin-protein ligase ptr1 [Nosema granulosis]|uniref:HECT-type E3 ubiquitin transferase n=1 Tax=Nosema granulosis TaxID=83296 RepID=A0A9P6H254_9MICR|nr:E3 ubiquitin-protein ligase ptr1 [Nosema granulosis]